MSKGERDDIIPLSRFRAALARPRGYRRVEALLESPDPAAAVASLSAPELYYLVKEVGFGDVRDLILLATPDQLRGCLDLDAWDRDRVQLEAMEPWLQAVLDVGFEKLGEVWAGFDPELRALFLARTTRIYDHSLDEAAPEDEERPMFTTPDTFFTVVITTEREDQIALVYRLIDDLYRADMVLARHTLLTARSEPTAELEEMSYRWRSGRMADHGYADFYEALEVFRPLDLDAVRLGEETADPASLQPEESPPVGLPVPLAEPVSGTFLGQTLEQVTDAAEAERLELGLVYLVNRVLSALRVAASDEEAVRAATQRAAATVSLGLEHVTGGRIERAQPALASISLVRLHRLGHSLTLRLARMARLLAPRAITAGEPSHSVLAALLRPRPLFAQAVDDPPSDDARPFRSLQDLRRAAEHLTELAVRVALADALGVDLLAVGQAPEPRPELDDHVRTALARQLGGGPLDSAPLSLDELEGLRARALAGGRLLEEARRGAVQALVNLAGTHRIAVAPEVLARLASDWLDRLEEELGGVARGRPIDVRSVGGVITSAHKT